LILTDWDPDGVTPKDRMKFATVLTAKSVITRFDSRSMSEIAIFRQLSTSQELAREVFRSQSVSSVSKVSSAALRQLQNTLGVQESLSVVLPDHRDRF
jgi:hypothetical protein